MGWLREVAGFFGGIQAALKKAMMLHMEQHPKSPLPLFAALRRWKPTLVLGNFAIVTKYEDVQEVLTRSDAFRVTRYPPRMEPILGPTPLAMDHTPEYQHDVCALSQTVAGPPKASSRTPAPQQAVAPDDSKRIRDCVNQTASQILERAKSAGWIDLVRDLANRVPVQLCGEYFGTPGRDEQTQLEWVRTLYYEMFIVQDTAAISSEAMAIGEAWKQYVYGLMAQRRADRAAKRPVPDDVLERLVREQPRTSLSDERICGNLIHMMIGFLPQMAKVTALAVEELIDRPEQLAGAQRAARTDNDALLGAYVWEALRFNAHPAMLFRQCAWDLDHTLARGTRRAARVPAGAATLAALQSAMFDEEVLDRPKEFRLDRPWEHYLFFGLGQHECMGQYMSRLAVPLIAKPLLCQQNLRRAPRAAGRMKWDRVFPESMVVKFDPA